MEVLLNILKAALIPLQVLLVLLGGFYKANPPVFILIAGIALALLLVKIRRWLRERDNLPTEEASPIEQPRSD